MCIWHCIFLFRYRSFCTNPDKHRILCIKNEHILQTNDGISNSRPFYTHFCYFHSSLSNIFVSVSHFCHKPVDFQKCVFYSFSNLLLTWFLHMIRYHTGFFLSEKEIKCFFLSTRTCDNVTVCYPLSKTIFI